MRLFDEENSHKESMRDAIYCSQINYSTLAVNQFSIANNEITVCQRLLYQFVAFKETLGLRD